ncbi:MAG: hypothetical protein WBQ43_22335 [Terriglobales bacterium]
MKPLAPSLKPINSLDSFQKHLPMYALAASAAGVSVLALSQPAEAEVVYTPTNTQIGINQTVALDLTGDGTTDFNLKDVSISFTDVFVFVLGVEPFQTGNAVAITAAEKFRSEAADLGSGHRIGPKTKFGGSYFGSSVRMASGHISSSPFRSVCRGPWKNKQNRYLGLKFMISGEVHYGWARLSVTCNGAEITGVLTGYAYETIANKAIKAGQETGTLDESMITPDKPTPTSVPVPTSATLGMLAKGAQALDLWR